MAPYEVISARGARLSPSEAQPGQQAAEPTFTARPYAPLRACFASGRVHRTCGTGAGRATRPYSRTRRPCTTGCSLQPPRRVPRRGADASGSYGLGFALGAPGGMRALAPGRYPACITRAACPLVLPLPGTLHRCLPFAFAVAGKASRRSRPRPERSGGRSFGMRPVLELPRPSGAAGRVV